ncbi:xanthine dehydrogenase family protein molybdopterin-binding subunit [Xanthocytophaga flava]|uniref:xanthine dehydrogenase family protein molybdopterin-binding subunit n=1 Tax=Xanthocytophaga flava TaxID=3048013 RepID=UPI0028D5106D|nr:xanthine dehydrogenase family protein molybdopterin-binding subunit [Xanthocytophaga flavus]MDJ1472717.1 xanthine dehydrogenase family protein molybdopterin-binding subunit [Xanthocytophaga flavus]
MKKKNQINRRDFLKAGTLAGGGLLISILLPPTIKNYTSPSAFSPHAFLRIDEDEDNSIHIILSKVEMGQGIWTTLPMLIAEELDCDWKNIQITHSPPGKKEDFQLPPVEQSTGGSSSTTSEFDRYRQAGATARIMLIQAAAQKWGVQPASCKTENGYVISGTKRVSYSQLTAEASKLPIPSSVQLRPPNEWKYIGKPQKRLDAPIKVNGQAKFGMDMQFPNLLTAVVAHAPAFGGKVKSFNADLAKAIQGVHGVFQIPTGIAVLATNYWTAQKAKETLKIEWDLGPNEEISSSRLVDSYSKLAKTKGKVAVQKESKTIFPKAKHVIDVDYVFPYLSHSPMEPLNCTVQIQDNLCEVWTGTQSPLLHQQEIATFLKLSPEQVLFQTPFLGGSFGRRGSFQGDWVMEAVQIAQVSGQFIKLVWSREDDIQGGYYRPMYLHKVHIEADEAGNPITWNHSIVGQSLFVNTPLESWIAPKGIDYSSVDGVNGSPYLEITPNHLIELHTTTVGVPVLPWRSVGNTHTAFVMETLIDQLAARISQDPVVYRRMLLKNYPRHLTALNLAAEKAGWHTSPPKGVFRGVAVHAAMGSYVCQIVELSIQDHQIRIHRVVCAIDCGLAVNPDGVCAQMESGIIYGLTAALYGEITIEKGRVKQSNFHDYPILRMSETPKIEVYIANSTAKMGGVGEPGVPPIAPALANAIFAATGKHIHTLPIRL